MKNILSLTLITIISLTSCEQKLEVKKVDEMHQTHKKIDVEVVNDLDSICGMPTAEHLSDTVKYEGKIYGFCSTMCKEEFLKDPKKYQK